MKNTVFYGIIGGILVLLVAVVWLSVPRSRIPSKFVTHNDSRIYYTDAATKEEAEDLGKFMGEIQYFSEDKKRVIKLDKDSGGYIVSVFARNSQLADPAYGKTLAIIGQGISLGVFSGQKVKVWACDQEFKKLKEF